MEWGRPRESGSKKGGEVKLVESKNKEEKRTHRERYKIAKEVI